MALFADALRVKRECIHRDTCQLVGVSHLNMLGNARMPLVSQLSIGTPLVLIPEPDNPLDRNAILVYGPNDLANDLGYIQYQKAAQICALIERGAVYEAQLYWFDRRNPDFPVPYIYLFKMQEPFLPRRPVRQNTSRYRSPAP